MKEEPDFVRAKRKISDARSWRGDVTVSLGDETVTFKHRLLTEGEFTDLKRVLDTSSLSDQSDVAQTDAQERLLELQQKEEELDEAEEAELRELTQQVAEQSDTIEDALGEEGYTKLIQLGKECIKPSQSDVDYVYDAKPDEARRLMGVNSLPNPLTKEAIRERLEHELESMIDNQPYPIKLNVGMQAFSETISVLGNGLQK